VRRAPRKSEAEILKNTALHHRIGASNTIAIRPMKGSLLSRFLVPKEKPIAQWRRARPSWPLPSTSASRAVSILA
jgi:hypothetical protein